MIILGNTIKTGKVVNLKYTLRNAQGEVLDQSDSAEPFLYLHGSSQIIPGLESALEGLKAGDKKMVVVAPENGYGEKDQNLVIQVKRSQFPENADIQPGMQFESRSPDGYSMVFTVAGVSGDEVTIDGNHPMAGVTLHFDVEVMDVRDATEEEKTHGHAHGPGGHHHH
jgi:FKBP-type peptidyl-prolyl cis-trans isomerase SlyD